MSKQHAAQWTKDVV